MDGRGVSLFISGEGFSSLAPCPLHVMVAHPGSQGALPARRELEEGEAEGWLSRDAQLQNESAAAGTAWPRSSLIPTSKGLRTRRSRTRSPGHSHGSHVAAPCPFPPELQTGAASRIRTSRRGRVGCGHRRGPRSGAMPGTCQLRVARGAPGSLLAAALGRA